MTTISDAELRAKRELLLERSWLERRMMGDALFAQMGSTHRDYACVGRLFVAWHVKDGQPLIQALFRADSPQLLDNGLAVKFRVVRPGRDDRSSVWALQQPQKVPGLDLYLWTPAFGDVHYTPSDYTKPDGPHLVRVSFLSKTHSSPLHRQVEGRTYFASKRDFCTLWPDQEF